MVFLSFLLKPAKLEQKSAIELLPEKILNCIHVEKKQGPAATRMSDIRVQKRVCYL